MADKFNPRGSPVPQNPYDGWDLTHRPAMLPFLAEYTNAQGEKDGGWAMPEMVEEPINALSRLLNTPAGTMPDPQDPQNQQDMLELLVGTLGSNALGGMARGALGRGAARGLEMEAARPVAYSNALETAFRNPNMLRMMDDIDYAALNRRALDDYGVGYEGLSSSQEAALRGWSDPNTLLSNTARPSLLGASLLSAGQASPAFAQSNEQSPGDYLKDQHQNRELYQQDYQSVPPVGYDQWERQQIDDLVKANPGMKKWDARERLYKSPEFRKKQQDFLKGSKHIPFDEIPPGDFIPHR